MTRGEGGHTAVPPYANLIGYTYLAVMFGKRRIDRPNNSKKSPQDPSDFCQLELVYIGLLEYGLKISENCSLPKKTAVSK
jgi:hypothetical protein